MKTVISVLTVLSVFVVVSSYPTEDQNDHVDIISYDDAKMHFFVVMVPETSVQKLKKVRARQDEGGEIVTETGVYVGQIISGVLGGDVRPIFAGSASFIDEPDVQQGVSTILANVAPSLNNILKGWVSRVQTALGISTTPKPGSVVLGANTTQAGNGDAPSNGVIVGRPIRVPQATRLTPQQLAAAAQQQQQQTQSQNLAQELSYIPERIAGSNVISGNDLYGQTTVEPLPLINYKPGGDGDDENEESFSDLKDKVKKLK